MTVHLIQDFREPEGTSLRNFYYLAFVLGGPLHALNFLLDVWIEPVSMV